MSKQFYRAFEDRYRGSREMIKERLRSYMPFLDALRTHFPGVPAIDLGCGRGEWLELLAEKGFIASGVDLDDGMLAACRELALEVSKQDALAALAALPDESVALVSAFHLVEHLPFDSVGSIVTEARRVLVPGGLLIMETPNPENIVVGTCDFYTDPSHLRPIPPNLLAFVTDHVGFARHVVVRLQEDPNLREHPSLGLISVIEGASPDYSVIAQQEGAPAVLSGFDAAFAINYGLDTKTLALRYDAQAAERHADIHHAMGGLAERISQDRASTMTEHRQVSSEIARLASDYFALSNEQMRVEQEQRLLTGKVAQLTDVMTQLQAHLEQREQTDDAMQAITLRLAELDQQMRTYMQASETEARLWARYEKAEQLAEQHAQRIADLMQSRSWRFAAPLRLGGAVARRLGTGGPKPWRGRAVKLLRLAVQATLRRPRLSHLARALMGRMPGLQSRLRAVLSRYDAAASQSTTQVSALSEAAPLPAASPSSEPAPNADLPMRTARVYSELKQAFEARKNN